MSRPKKKEIKFSKDSILAILQEIYNEIVKCPFDDTTDKCSEISEVELQPINVDTNNISDAESVKSISFDNIEEDAKNTNDIFEINKKITRRCSVKKADASSDNDTNSDLSFEDDDEDTNDNDDVEYEEDSSDSTTQRSKIAGKSGWCYIGEDRGVKKCIQVGKYDLCDSGIVTNEKC